MPVGTVTALSARADNRAQILRVRVCYECDERGSRDLVWAGMHFDSVKIFSATMAADRARLGDVMTAWLHQEPREIVDVVIRQSSDASFHCLSFCIFYRRRP